MLEKLPLNDIGSAPSMQVGGVDHNPLRDQTIVLLILFDDLRVNDLIFSTIQRDDDGKGRLS
jgi:hypothetical protein